jgi:hypothetical protein
MVAAGPPKFAGSSGAENRANGRRTGSIERESVPLFVTLTFPDTFPEYRDDYKNYLDLLGQRLLRRFPGAAAICKLE